MDGLETIRILRRSEPKVKIIAMSGYAFREGLVGAPDYLQIAVELGAAAPLRKPFTAGELLEVVEESTLTAPAMRTRIAASSAVVKL
jgi:CheY-like chemotaxis protein